MKHNVCVWKETRQIENQKTILKLCFQNKDNLQFVNSFLCWHVYRKSNNNLTL